MSDAIDLPPMTDREFDLPDHSPPSDTRSWVREGLWIRVYDRDDEYLGDVDWPHLPPGMLQ